MKAVPINAISTSSATTRMSTDPGRERRKRLCMLFSRRTMGVVIGFITASLFALSAATGGVLSWLLRQIHDEFVGLPVRQLSMRIVESKNNSDHSRARRVVGAPGTDVVIGGGEAGAW